MRSLDSWLNEYGQSHRHPTNQLVHKICVPAIMFSILGIFWTIPEVGFMSGNTWLNWSTLFACACLVYYIMLDVKYFVAMLATVTAMLMVVKVLAATGILLQISIGIFIISWALQFWGHKIEGKKPSFLKDIAFLLIGPLWVWRSFFKTLGINS